MTRAKTTAEALPFEEKGAPPIRVTQNVLQDIEKLDGYRNPSGQRSWVKYARHALLAVEAGLEFGLVSGVIIHRAGTLYVGAT
jgi:hypothetical protein